MSTSFERQAGRMVGRARARMVEDLERLMADCGIGVTELARHAGLSHGYVSDILAGREAPSDGTWARLAVPLGADLAMHLYPNTGPAIRDRHQARIFEALLEIAHPRWQRFGEVGVWKRVRGTIDAVFHEPREQVVVATEIESDVRRIEQTVRWSKEKAEALPSWSGWSALSSPAGAVPSISQLLVVRRTRANRQLARAFAQQLVLAYPAHPEDAIASLARTAPWPGAALVWVAVEAGDVRWLSGR